MKVAEIEVKLLRPCAWNVNRMTPAMRKKLAAYIKKEGLVEPLVVRPHPSEEGAYELIGGEHRWRVCSEDLGYKTVPCVVLHGLDDRRAKILSVNLNELSGAPVPSLLSKLLHDLNATIPLDEMAASLPYDTSEIEDVMALMRLPTDFIQTLEAEASEADENAPAVVTLVFDRDQAEAFETAVAQAIEQHGIGGKNPRTRAVEVIARHYLATRATRPAPAETAR